MQSFDSYFLKKYDPKQIIGRGTYGCVFEAKKLDEKVMYAIKRIPVIGSEEEVDKALNEIRTLANLHHEGIVGYKSAWLEEPPEGWQGENDTKLLKRIKYGGEPFDYRDDCFFLYIQMELCAQTLYTWLNHNRWRDIDLSKAWFKQIVAAVGYLHDMEQPKIHRDLKPQNILFGTDGRMKICDMGLATDRVIRNGVEIDKTRSSRGSIFYMAPEQHGLKYTAKVDIYSLGLIFLELCVCLSDFNREDVFHNYRRGRGANTILADKPEADAFVALLTNSTPENRPDCKDILRHQYLA